MTETDELLYGVDAEGIARITLNRPQARNALTFAMYERLHGLSLAIDADPAVRAVVIQGAGGRAFAARHRHRAVSRLLHGRGCAGLRALHGPGARRARTLR